MNLELAGHVAAVVGGANGMGRMIAKTFAAEGAHVALLDRDPVVDEIATRPPRKALLHAPLRST